MTTLNNSEAQKSTEPDAPGLGRFMTLVFGLKCAAIVMWEATPLAMEFYPVDPELKLALAIVTVVWAVAYVVSSGVDRYVPGQRT